MIICVAGKNNIAVDVLEYLILVNNGRYGLCVICNEERREIKGFQKSLQKIAEKHNIPNLSLEDVYEIDDLIFLSMEYDRIVKPSKFKKARLYNIHFSLLPAYKGMYTSAIPILNGEEYVGVTLHKIDEGIDTGDIIAQYRIRIEDTDTCRDVYCKYLKYGAELVVDHLEEVIGGKESSIPQETKGASYYPKGYIDYANLSLDLNNVAINIYRQVRAYSFREYQMPALNGKQQIIWCEITQIKSNQTPGKILLENANSYLVATVDYDIILYKDRFEELLEACSDGNLDAVKDICVCKKHINEQNSRGWTPLIVATYNGHYDIVEYLILNGANIYIRNFNGTNLAMYAKDAFRKLGKRDLFDMYCKLGVSLHQTDNYGRNTIDYINNQHLEDLLEGHDGKDYV